MAYRKLKGLSIEQHRVLGKKLKKIQKEHTDIINEVWAAYGKCSKAGTHVRSCIKLDKLLLELDDHVCRETRLGPWHEECFSYLYRGMDFDKAREERELPKWEG